MKKMKKILSLLLAATLTFGSLSAAASAALPTITKTTRPADGVTEDQPFAAGTGGSANFRIPCLVTLDDGTIVAACDARWNHASDACGLDTIVSRSTDGGKTWNYTFANYLGDNGNVFNYNSTAFIDPAIATDGEKIWMIADIYPAGVAINTVPSTHNARPGHTGYDANHNLVLAKATDSVNGLSATNSRIAQPFDYTLVKIEGAADTDASYYNIIDKAGNVVEGYEIDAFFNIKGNGVDTNLFIGDSPYFPWPTDFLYMTSSEDGGATWSIPTLIDVKRADEQTLLVGPGRGIVTTLPDGTERIIFTAYDFTYSDDKSSAIYSDDGGKTWTRGADVAAWSSESVVTEADGKLYLFTRHGNAYYISENYGESWGPQLSTGLAYNSNCQLTAITYSEKVDGKTAILFAAPSSTSSRANGKIFVGLVQEDGTLDWAYEYEVNKGNYAYSCMDELENGNIGLLYESAGSAITYTELSMREILGFEQNLVLDQGDVYVDERTAEAAAEITQKPDESIATVSSEFVVEESTTLLYDHVSNTNSSLDSFSTTANVANSLEKAEVVLTNVSENTYKVYNPATGKYAYKASSGTNGAQINLGDNADSAEYQLVLEPTKSETGTTFRLYRASDSQRYTIFYNNNMDFNTNGGYNAAWQGPGASGSYELVLLEKQESVSETDVIPGYARVSEITSGETYLISYIWENVNNANDPVNGSVFVLDPTQNGTGGQTKLVGDTVSVVKNVITITAVAPGETTAVVGDVTYNITVNDPADSPTYAGNDLPTEGMKLTAGTLETTEGSLEALLDGDGDSFYHSNWSGARPTDADFWITIELPEVTAIAGMRYLPRQSSPNGRILKYEISYSLDGKDWTVGTAGNWTDDFEWKVAKFEEGVEAKFVKIFAVDSKADNSGRHMTAAELRVLKATGPVAPTPEVTPDPTPAVTDKTALLAAIAAAEALNAADYTAESWSQVQSMLTMAKVLASSEVSQFEVDYVSAALEEAIAALVEVEKPEVTPDPTPEVTPDPTPEVTPDPTPTPDEKEDVSDLYPDVKDGAWYEVGVQFVYDAGLMSGSNGLFNPTADITRAQIVTTLYRLAGEPEVTDTKALTDFTDVAEGKYYTDAVCWAYANGVATGNDGKFDPTGKLTRQQMAAFFFRYADVMGMDTTARGDYSSMVNADKVSGYAAEPLGWAVGEGLISGSDVTVNGVAAKDLNPRGNTTRAQVATILMRFCEE